MQVDFTPEEQALVDRLLSCGRVERGNLLLALDEAEADIEAGRYRDFTDETLPQLAEEIKREGRLLRNQKLNA